MELTPKQKAEELVNKYIPHIAGADRYNSTLGIYDKEISKQCVLIAVNEIIKIKTLWFQKDTKDIDFWEEVKRELLKM